MSVPRIFGTQAAGNVPANYLDEDFAYVLSSAGIGTIARVKLATTLNLYVRTDAVSDAPTVYADTPTGAFQTWQAAVDIALAYDFNGHTVIIKAGEEGAPKTWDLGSGSIVVRTISGIGALYFRGSTDGTTINNTGAPIFFLAATISPVFLGAIAIASLGSGHGLVEVSQQSLFQLDPAGGPDFGLDDFAHIYVHDGQAQAALLNSSYTISGDAPYHIFATSASNVSLEGCTVTFSVPVACFNFVVATNNAYIQSTLCTFVNPGNLTGSRFLAAFGGRINTLTNGAYYFPGSTDGQQLSLGIYNDLWTTTPVFLEGGFYATTDSQVQKANPTLIVSKAASGETATFAGKINGIAQWDWVLGNATAISGSNVGADASLYAYGDAGAFIGTAVEFTRKTLAALFGGALRAIGAIKTDAYYASTVPREVTGATDSIVDTDNIVVCNRAGTVTLTLPTPANYAGRRLRVLTVQNQTVVSASSNVVPIIGGSAATAILAGTAGKAADLDCDGANWRITMSN